MAYRGLDSWTFIGIGWLLHTAWDIVHHIEGNPIIPFLHTSSLGCAICDPVIALSCFAGGKTRRESMGWVRGVRERRDGAGGVARGRSGSGGSLVTEGRAGR